MTIKDEAVFIPSFYSVDAARAYAEVNHPFQKAMEDFQNRDYYSKYGERPRQLAMQIHEDILAGKQEAARKGMKALSLALPTWVFDYERRGR